MPSDKATPASATPRRRCQRCGRILRRRQRLNCSKRCKKARLKLLQVTHGRAAALAAVAQPPGLQQLAARLAEERGAELADLRALAERLGLQMLDGKQPEVPAAVTVPEGATAEYGQLLAIYQARGKASYRRQVERFATAQAGLARAYANRWAGGDHAREDLEQAALLGLLEAISHWSPDKARGGWQKHAFLWMRHHVQQLVHRQGLVREPHQVHLDRKALQRALRREPELTDEELVERTGLSLRRVRLARLPAPRAVFDEEGDDR